ncbi:hypothetical protein EVAR_63643_1 [Eumeta japonica]|uniref:Peptidase aspartic putative domain-containing protein n=1 Tax=Eumeta variegata TaxID=151549 RepID=A0A4C1ZDX0_EUMVA|nr:hypothetical protein EVAR_63643_1 [Eumeta japonica]
MVGMRSTGCRGKKVDDQPQEELRMEPRDSPESPSVIENTTTAQMTHGEATVAESVISTSSKRAPTVKLKTSRRREARLEADISSGEECEAASVTESSRGRVGSWLETQPPRNESPPGCPSAPEWQTTADNSHDMRPELRGRSPPCPIKESPLRPEENITVLRNETGAGVCTNKESKNTEIDGIVTALKEIVKCLPRSQAQHQPSSSSALQSMKKERGHVTKLLYFSGNYSDWLVFRTGYRQTAPYLEEIDNIVRLRKHIVGAAAEATKTLFISERSSQEILDYLEQRYGTLEALVIAETNKLQALPKIGEEPYKLYEFSAKVNGVVGTVKALDKTKELNNPEIIHVAISKLSHALSLKWEVRDAWEPRATVLLKIIPVVIRGATATLSTFALLDEGSTVTLIEAAIAERVGATGPEEPFTIEGVAESGTSIGSSHCSRPPYSAIVDTESIIEECDYLADIRHQIAYENSTLTILLGQDNWHLIVTRGVRSGGLQQPAASFTELGWVLHGPCSRRGWKDRVNLIQSQEEEQEDSIEKLIKEHVALDNIGITPRRPKTDPDKRALDILEKESRRTTDGRFQTGLIWRKEDVDIPNNRNTELSRLHNLEKKLKYDVELKHETGGERVLHCTSTPESIYAAKCKRT